MKKLLNLILQVLQWLFLVAYYNDLVSNVDEFFRKYVKINKKDISYIELMTIPRRFPIYEDFNHYFIYLSNYCPALISNNKLIFNQDLANKLQQYLEYFHLKENNVPIYIRNYYQTIDDFKSLSNTLIFLNDETLNAYLQHQINVNYTVKETIYPYIYKTNYGKLFIIQNTYNNLLGTAYSIVEFWHNYQINVGPNGDKTIEDINPNIYKVNDLGEIELVYLGDTKYHVLDYNYRAGKIGGGKYAAMLPLN